jgi:limonene-1,2-epoxide hydrolase
MNRRRFVHTTIAVQLVAAAAGRNSYAKEQAMTDHLVHVTTLIKAWRRKDVLAVLASVTDDINWHTHVGSPPVVGKDAMQKMLDALAVQMSDVRWRIFDWAQRGDRIYLEGVDDFVSPEGRRVVLPYAGVLVFRGNLISEWRDYFDRNVFNKLKAGEALPDYLQGLTEREALF